MPQREVKEALLDIYRVAQKSFHGLLFGSAIVASSITAFAQTSPSESPRTPEALEKAKAYIVESEKQWAGTVTSGDTAVIKRIFADDFVGVDSDGHMYDKATFIAEIVEAPKYFASNAINAVQVRFFGDTAVAQGDESFTMRAGEVKQGRYVFTDTWVLRNGQWQVVATEVLIAKDTPK